MNIVALLVTVFLAIGCVAPNTVAETESLNDVSDQMSQDEIADALKEVIDNLEEQDATSFPDDFNVTDLMQALDSAAEDSSVEAAEIYANEEQSQKAGNELDAFSDALADILAGRAGDLTKNAVSEIESQNTRNNFDTISDALADILAGRAGDPINDAANEVESQKTPNDLDAISDALADILADASGDETSDEANESAEKRRGSGRLVRGRGPRRRLRDRRRNDGPATEEEPESESTQERSARRRDRNRERTRRVPNTTRLAGRGIRRSYGDRINSMREATSNVIETAGNVMETAVEIGAGLQHVAKDVGSGVQDLISNIDFEQLNETAVKTTEYFMQLADWNLPKEIVNDLLTTRAGGAADTVKAIIEAKDVKPIMEDLGKNYVKVWQKVEEQMDLLIGSLLAKTKAVPPS